MAPSGLGCLLGGLWGLLGGLLRNLLGGLLRNLLGDPWRLGGLRLRCGLNGGLGRLLGCLAHVYLLLEKLCEELLVLSFYRSLLISASTNPY
jgi:hypothetical protein